MKKEPPYFSVWAVAREGWGIHGNWHGLVDAPNRKHWMRGGTLLMTKSEGVARYVCDLLNKEIRNDVDYCRKIQLR